MDKIKRALWFFFILTIFFQLKIKNSKIYYEKINFNKKDPFGPFFKIKETAYEIET